MTKMLFIMYWYKLINIYRSANPNSA